MIYITLPGEPVAKIRPRITRKGGYDPQAQLKHAAKFQILDQVNKYDYLPYAKNIPVEIEFNFYFPIPKGKENLYKWGLLDQVDKKDFDNLEKFYCDAMNKIVYIDDRQINSCNTKKLYGHTPRTEIIIMPKKTCSDKAKEVLSIVSMESILKLSNDLINLSDHMHFDGFIEHNRAARLICEFAETHAANLTKINKKFPGYAKLLRDEKE